MNDTPPPSDFPEAQAEDDIIKMYEEEANLLQRGDYHDITRKIPGLSNVKIGAGWDHKAFEENPLDLDLSCFMLNRQDQTREDEDFVFYNNERACDGAIRHQGDSRNGAGDGDDEMILIDLKGVPFDVIRIVFTLTIYNAPERGQELGMVRNMYLRMVNADDENEIFRVKLPEIEFEGQIGIKVGELVREGPKWFFNVTNDAIPGGLATIATQYGIIIQMA